METATVIEERHRDIVERALTGELESRDARMQVAALIVESGAAARVARERSAHVPHQQVADLAVVINDVLVDKVLDPDVYDFASASSGTLLGWAMTYGRTTKANRLANVYSRQKTTPFSAHLLSGGDRAVESISDAVDRYTSRTDAWSTLTHHTSNEDESFELALELLAKNRKGLRERGRIFVDAAVLCLSYRLPLPTCPQKFEDKAFVLSVLETDRTAARRSLADYKDIAALNMDASATALDHRLLDLWDSFSLDDAEQLLELPSLAVETIALSAVRPKPRPAARSLNKLAISFKSVSAADGWNVLASKIADSYVAANYEALSEFHAVRDIDNIVLRDHGRAIADFDSLIDAAANFPGHPLGVTPAAIRRALSKTASALLGDVFNMKDVR